MSGIVIWSDTTHRKAVIWCEKLERMVFLSKPCSLSLDARFLEVADLVEFELAEDGSVHEITLQYPSNGAETSDTIVRAVAAS